MYTSKKPVGTLFDIAPEPISIHEKKFMPLSNAFEKSFLRFFGTMMLVVLLYLPLLASVRGWHETQMMVGNFILY